MMSFTTFMVEAIFQFNINILIPFHSVNHKDKKLPAGGAQCQRNQILEIWFLRYFSPMF